MTDAETVSLGFAALGGREWRQASCTCDASVGAVPCEYCALHAALCVGERLAGEMAELNDGRRVVLPKSDDHARAMAGVAVNHLESHGQQGRS